MSGIWPVAAFLSLPLAIIWLSQIALDGAVDAALALFVLAQAIKLIAVGERLTRDFGG